MKFSEIPFERIERNFFSPKENDSVITSKGKIVNSKGTTVGTVYGTPAVVFTVPPQVDTSFEVGDKCSVSYFDEMFVSLRLDTFKDWIPLNATHLTGSHYHDTDFIEEANHVLICTVRLITTLKDQDPLIVASIDAVLNKKAKYRDRFLGCSESIMTQE